MINSFSPFLFFFLVYFEISKSAVTEKKREEIPGEFKWDLSPLFESPEEWEKRKNSVEREIEKNSFCKNELGKDAKTLFSCLNRIYNLKKEFERLYVYATADFSTQRGSAMKKDRLDRIQLLATKFQSAISFLEPELLKIEENKIWNFIKEEKGLEVYNYYFKDLIRRKPYVLNEKEEEIIALSGDLRTSPYAMLNALQLDVKFPLIKDEEGRDVELTQANFPKYRASEKREVRKECVEKFFLTFKNFENSFAASLDMAVKADIFIAKSRGFPDALSASLFQNAIPVELYKLLIEVTSENLKSCLHKYVSLRKEVLKLDKIYYYDLYNPLVEKISKAISYNEGVEIVLKSLAPLGKEYVEVSKTAIKTGSGWVDIYPNKEKRSGAYCIATYGEHPYMLLNFNNELEDVFTLTHELGHAMHYYFSMKNQPYPKYEAPIFLAEIASTFNEELLISYLLKNAKTREEKLFLLNKRLENIRTTVFRQVMFAEFELLLHKEVEEGRALTAKRIGEIYRSLIEKYYGEGFTVGENDSLEWAYIPHFYYNFYVFQYATGLMSAIALSQKVLRGEKGAVEKYFEFLNAGGSDYPIEILKKAGIDFSKREAMQETFELFKKTLLEFEKVYKK